MRQPRCCTISFCLWWSSIWQHRHLQRSSSRCVLSLDPDSLLMPKLQTDRRQTLQATGARVCWQALTDSSLSSTAADPVCVCRGILLAAAWARSSCSCSCTARSSLRWRWVQSTPLAHPASSVRATSQACRYAYFPLHRNRDRTSGSKSNLHQEHHPLTTGVEPDNDSRGLLQTGCTQRGRHAAGVARLRCGFVGRREWRRHSAEAGLECGCGAEHHDASRPCSPSICLRLLLSCRFARSRQRQLQEP